MKKLKRQLRYLSGIYVEYIYFGVYDEYDDRCVEYFTNALFTF